MYNTVHEVHLAIMNGLNQINSNRKQAFRPEQYDALIHTELLQYIDDKIDPKSNIKKEGFEATVRRVDELKDLKKLSTLRFYDLDSETKYTILPADYYRIIVGGNTAKIHYNKSTINKTAQNETRYKYTLAFADDIPSAQGVACYRSIRMLNGTNIDKTYTKSSYSQYSKFEIIRFFLDHLIKDKNYNAYWEYYNGAYTANSFIITTTTQLTGTLTLSYTSGATGTPTITTTAVETTDTLVYNISGGNIIYRPIELISSQDKREILRNYYISRNRHNKPICTIEGNYLKMYYSSNFLPLEIELDYIVKPRKISYYYNQMPDIKITNELVQRVIDKLKIFIKDEQAYNMFLNQMQQLK